MFWSSKYFGATVAHLVLVFVPVAYLLWAFPAWESMHAFGSRDEIRAIVPHDRLVSLFSWDSKSAVGIDTDTSAIRTPTD